MIFMIGLSGNACGVVLLYGFQVAEIKILGLGAFVSKHVITYFV